MNEGTHVVSEETAAVISYWRDLYTETARKLSEAEKKIEDLKLRNSLLRNRTDLPLECRREYAEVERQLAEYEACRKVNRELLKEKKELEDKVELLSSMNGIFQRKIWKLESEHPPFDPYEW